MSACRKPSKKAALVSSPSPAGAISISDSALTAGLVRERRGDGAAERMADEMRFAARPPRSCTARAASTSASKLALLAERRETMAGQVDRQRRARLGQQALHRPPAVEIGAEAVQEHDRRALRRAAATADGLFDAVRAAQRRRFSMSRSWTRPRGPDPLTLLEPQSALARHSSSGGRRARAQRPHPAPKKAVR